MFYHIWIICFMKSVVNHKVNDTNSNCKCMYSTITFNLKSVVAAIPAALELCIECTSRPWTRAKKWTTHISVTKMRKCTGLNLSSSVNNRWNSSICCRQKNCNFNSYSHNLWVVSQSNPVRRYREPLKNPPQVLWIWCETIAFVYLLQAGKRNNLASYSQNLGRLF